MSTVTRPPLQQPADARSLTGSDTGSETGSLPVPAAVTAAPRLSQRHPALYPWAVRAHRVRRRWAWLRSGNTWAVRRPVPDASTYRVKQHRSLLLRRLGESEMWLQHNKVVNLRLAAACTDQVVIRPGETFSFNKVVGNCTERRGFVEGMKLSNGDAESGVGGGICQLANLLHWMFLHSPLTVVERSEHSFDPFPDKGRVLPWGVGCSIVYNYVDLVVRNDTDATFVISTKVGPRYLEGELRADRPLPHSYSVEARHERFVAHEGRIFRINEIWRTVIDRRTGNGVRQERVKQNCALVKYLPEHVEVLSA